MNEELKEQALVYLDQTILCDLADDNPPGLVRVLHDRDDIVPVFSFPHLDEISRVPEVERRDQLLKCLKEMHALWLEVDRQGVGHLSHKEPAQVANEYWANQEENRDILQYQQNLAFAISSGADKQHIEQIEKQGGEAFIKLLDSLVELCDDLPPDLVPNMESRAERVKKIEELKAGAHQIFSGLSDVWDPEGLRKWGDNSDRAFREAFGLDSVVLNNVPRSQVVDEVLVALGSQDDLRPDGWDPKEGLKAWFKGLQGAVSTPFSEILAGYLFLDSAGYWPDKHKQDRAGHGRHMSDATHVSCAAFCQVFLTLDKAQAKKAKAIYEHLGIATHVERIARGRPA